MKNVGGEAWAVGVSIVLLKRCYRSGVVYPLLLLLSVAVYLSIGLKIGAIGLLCDFLF